MNKDYVKIEFLYRLNQLLKEYNVSIEADVSSGSDTHGIFGRTLQIIHKEPNTVKETTWLFIDEWSLTTQELDEHLGF